MGRKIRVYHFDNLSNVFLASDIRVIVREGYLLFFHDDYRLSFCQLRVQNPALVLRKLEEGCNPQSLEKLLMEQLKTDNEHAHKILLRLVQEKILE